MSEPRIKGRSCFGSLAGALLVLLSLCVAAPAKAAELYGLVIGIDDYIGSVNDLEGAVNDAEDVAQSLNRAGAREVVRLLNDDASKDRIVAEWNRLMAKANAGDTIVFSYAGHGGQEPEPPGRHDEADGLNETFLLGHFEPTGPGTRERIIDDKVFEWMQ
jgi:Caspase domain